MPHALVIHAARDLRIEETPSEPLAPGRLSITTVCPSDSLKRGATMRASVSAGPPGGTATIMRMDWKVDAEGYVNLPGGPGLGIEVDEKNLEEAVKKPQNYKWPGKTLKDGSIADY